ncbi:MAG: ATP-binding protein [Rhodospirillales bacterium]|nr:ATP-binding protein [Rhodospirillales bacterium]
MLNHPTLDTLHALGLHGCATGFKALEADPAAAALSHAEWLALMLEHEVTHRRQKRFEARATRAKLRQAAAVEDVDWRAARGLDRTLFMKLATCQWIRDRRHVILCGPPDPDS